MSSTVGAGLSEGYGTRGETSAVREHSTKRMSCPKYQRGIDDDEIPGDLRLVSRDKLPRSFLCQRLRGQIDQYGPCCRPPRLHCLHRRIIPVAFIESARHGGLFANRRDRGGEDQTLQGTPMFQCGVQDRRGSPHSRDDEICKRLDRQKG
jgi:hypothetical protein